MVWSRGLNVCCAIPMVVACAQSTPSGREQPSAASASATASSATPSAARAPDPCLATARAPLDIDAVADSGACDVKDDSTVRRQEGLQAKVVAREGRVASGSIATFEVTIVNPTQARVTLFLGRALADEDNPKEEPLPNERFALAARVRDDRGRDVDAPSKLRLGSRVIGASRSDDDRRPKAWVRVALEPGASAKATLPWRAAGFEPGRVYPAKELPQGAVELPDAQPLRAGRYRVELSVEASLKAEASIEVVAKS